MGNSENLIVNTYCITKPITKTGIEMTIRVPRVTKLSVNFPFLRPAKMPRPMPTNSSNMIATKASFMVVG